MTGTLDAWASTLEAGWSPSSGNAIIDAVWLLISHSFDCQTGASTSLDVVEPTVESAVEVEVLNEATALSASLNPVEVEVLNEAAALSTALKSVEVEVLNEATELSTLLKAVEVEVLKLVADLSTTSETPVNCGVSRLLASKPLRAIS